MIDCPYVKNSGKENYIRGNKYSVAPYNSHSGTILKSKLPSTLKFADCDQVINAVFVSFDQPPKRQKNSKFTPFIESAQVLAQSGNDKRGIELIFEATDTFFHDGQFDEVDLFLSTADPSKFTIEVNVCLLAATIPGARELCHRSVFREKVYWYFIQTKVPDADALLNGL